MPQTSKKILDLLDDRVRPLFDDGGIFEDIAAGTFSINYKDNKITLTPLEDDESIKKIANKLNESILEKYPHDKKALDSLWSDPIIGVELNEDTTAGLFRFGNESWIDEEKSALITPDNTDDYNKVAQQASEMAKELDRIFPVLEVKAPIVRNSLINYAQRNRNSLFLSGMPDLVNQFTRMQMESKAEIGRSISELDEILKKQIQIADKKSVANVPAHLIGDYVEAHPDIDPLLGLSPDLPADLDHRISIELHRNRVAQQIR